MAGYAAPSCEDAPDPDFDSVPTHAEFSSQPDQSQFCLTQSQIKELYDQTGISELYKDVIGDTFHSENSSKFTSADKGPLMNFLGAASGGDATLTVQDDFQALSSLRRPWGIASPMHQEDENVWSTNGLADDLIEALKKISMSEIMSRMTRNEDIAKLWTRDIIPNLLTSSERSEEGFPILGGSGGFVSSRKLALAGTAVLVAMGAGYGLYKHYCETND